MKRDNKIFEHQYRSKRDNLLYTVRYGVKSNYYFIEAIDSNEIMKFVIESDELLTQVIEIMRAWGCNERNISSLVE